MTHGIAAEAYLTNLDPSEDLIYVGPMDLDPRTALFKKQVASLPVATPVAPLSEKTTTVLQAATIEEEIAALLDAEKEPACVQAALELRESDESASEQSSPSPKTRTPSFSMEELEAFFNGDDVSAVVGESDLDALNAL